MTIEDDDCDDLDPATNPLASDECCDGVDRSSNGVDDATATRTAYSTQSRTGRMSGFRLADRRTAIQSS